MSSLDLDVDVLPDEILHIAYNRVTPLKALTLLTTTALDHIQLDQNVEVLEDWQELNRRNIVPFRGRTDGNRILAGI